MSTLLLRLAAPMQAWGTDSKFETRRTGTEPSKSGVIGMVAAAMGIRRDGDLSRFNALRFAVRVDREGKLLRDYHTAKKDDKTSYVTNRYYLCDAVFVVGLEGDEAFLNEIGYALRHPAFPLFLGRRSCPPTMPLCLGVLDCGLEEALGTYERQDKQGQGRMRYVIDCDMSDPAGARLRDVPASFSPFRRQYTFRTAKEGYISLPDTVTDEHDPMSEL